MNYSIARDENFEISIHTYYSQATIFVRPNLVESSRYSKDFRAAWRSSHSFVRISGLECSTNFRAEQSTVYD